MRLAEVTPLANTEFEEISDEYHEQMKEKVRRRMQRKSGSSKSESLGVKTEERAPSWWTSAIGVSGVSSSIGTARSPRRCGATVRANSTSANSANVDQFMQLVDRN